MERLAEPLTDDEIEILDEFLLDRVDEEAAADGADEGVFEISGLDGFLTALVSGPVTIPPSRWLPAVWGDFEPEWESMEDAEFVLSLMIRHMNGIAGTLLERPEAFEPICYAREADGDVLPIVDEWCEGYMRGVGLAAEAWAAGGAEIEKLLAPIRAFTEAEAWPGHELESPEAFGKLQRTIPPSVCAIHAYWLERREKSLGNAEPVRRSGQRIGRNDPCPCGSGKKFKRCCLN